MNKGCQILAWILAIALAISIIVNIFQALWNAIGLWLVYIPAGLLGIFIILSIVGMIINAKEQKALLRKRKLAEAEAAAGIPLITDGTCHACGAPLLLGAKFCSQCRAAQQEIPMPRLCPKCATRNLDDAIYCAECGADLPKKEQR
jgi:flagellar biosynthesis protein FliQ